MITARRIRPYAQHIIARQARVPRQRRVGGFPHGRMMPRVACLLAATFNAGTHLAPEQGTTRLWGPWKQNMRIIWQSDHRGQRPLRPRFVMFRVVESKDTVRVTHICKDKVTL